MRLVHFPQVTVIIAKDQPEYNPLPAHVDREDGTVTCLWELTLRERLRLLWTGKRWHQIQAFGKPLQPQRLMVHAPPLKKELTYLEENEYDS